MPDVFSIRHTTVEAYARADRPRGQGAARRPARRPAQAATSAPPTSQLGGECWYVLGSTRSGRSPSPTRSRPNAACSSPTTPALDGRAAGAEASDADALSRSGWRWRGRRRSRAGGSRRRRPRSARARKPCPATGRPPDDAAFHDRRRRRADRRTPSPARTGGRAVRSGLALVLIVVWGANFTVQKAVFAALSPGGFLFVRYLIMPVAAALLLCSRYRPATGRGLARADLLALLRLGLARPPAARRPGHLRHPLVDRVLELADPRLRAGLHAADPALARPSSS